MNVNKGVYPTVIETYKGYEDTGPQSTRPKHVLFACSGRHITSHSFSKVRQYLNGNNQFKS